ncbi:MAG: RNA methyltransferase [Ezakiella sp.]|nr:RNA methyltransferase [Ezakiella sp.]MDD7471574.1 RNA methyltransferase [Bacillota bacterium]MDY3922810.1 RNA methyltransferase [Ezakiella sp.]
MITSRQNQNIKELVKIIERKSDQKDLFFLEGFTIFEEAIRERVIIKEIYVSASKADFFRNNYDLGFEIVDDNLLKSISNTKTGKDIIFLVKSENKIELEKMSEDLVILLDKVQDPGNFGTIIRTADAFGIKNILTINNCVDYRNEKVLRSSMGSILRVNIKKVELEDLKKLKQIGYKITTTSPKGKRLKYSITKTILVLGNEANGVSKEIMELSDNIATIPMKGNTESLNVAIAAGIAMYIMTEEHYD